MRLYTINNLKMKKLVQTIINELKKFFNINGLNSDINAKKEVIC